WSKAIYCYEQCLDLYHTLDDRYDIGMIKNNLGEVLQCKGAETWPEASLAYQEALEIYREFGDQYEEIDVLSNLASLHYEMGDLTTASNYYEQAMETIEALRLGVTSEAGRAGYLGTVISTYANAVLLHTETGNYERAFDTIERARSRAFLDLLVAGSPDFSAKVEASTMTLAEVQATLADDTLLLEYFTTGLLEARDKPAANSKRHRFPPAKTLILAVTRSQLQVVEADLSPNDLRPRSLEDVVEQHFLQPQIRRALYTKLIAPVEHLLPGKRRLYLAPHGPLHYIPFQALLAPDGDTLLREAGPQLIYAPSATLLCQQRPGPAQAPESCLSVGYNSQGETRLDFAEAEAGSIAGLTGGRAMVGPQPKKAELYRQAADYRLLHLACHGEFDPESALDSFLHLAPDEILTALDVLNHLHLQCELVTLSACESGLSLVRRGDELMGLMRAFMYAGTPALVST
ncbi:MAG: CHAT domain-containing protein, partial [Gammaproteobacteria bacterium]|nr:CHAT domain-containing protein [Gammaproteobacteria bacterium]